MQFQKFHSAIELLGPAKPLPEAPPPDHNEVANGNLGPKLAENSRQAGSQAENIPAAATAAAQPVPERKLTGIVQPKLGIAWGDFHAGMGSSIGVLLSRPFGRGPRDDNGRPATCPYLRDTRVESQVPLSAVVAAGLWHLAILALPISLFTVLPHRNPALRNVQLTWTGPINDLPLLEIPRAEPKPVAHVEAPRLLETPAPEAFHPRQRVFTDPVRPTHPRQTLINPAAPKLAPKLLPNLPNMVIFQQVAGPAKPRMEITEAMLKKAHPREKRDVNSANVPVQNAPQLEERVGPMDLAIAQDGPARPKLQLNAGAAPRVAPRKETKDVGAAPDLEATQMTAANGNTQPFVAISAAPAPPKPVVQPPDGNLAARVAMSPDGKRGGDAATAGAAGASSSSTKNSVGVSISGGNPIPKPNGGGSAATLNMPSTRVLITRPDPKAGLDDERTGPPDFAAVPPGAKPEIIFGSRKVYTLNVNMPNVSSSTGSWILHFSEFRTGDRPRMASDDLSGPVVMRKVDPKYPPTLVADHVEGEVVLYAVIRRDGSVDSIQLVRGVDQQLDANAMRALAQWEFRPASKAGIPVELEAIVHIPFRAPEE